LLPPLRLLLPLFLLAPQEILPGGQASVVVATLGVV